MISIIRILKYINSLPIRVTMKNYYAFDKATAQLKDRQLDSKESWEILRENHPHFSVSENRTEWLQAAESHIHKDGQDCGVPQRARDIVAIIEQLGITSIFSVGVGGAGLEYQIKKLMPSTHLTCSEYSQRAVDVLKKVFLECDSIVQFDITSTDWSPAITTDDKQKQLCLIYRVDASFLNEEWIKIFNQMSDEGIENILYIPTACLTVMGIRNRLYRKLLWRLRSIPYVFCGYNRTKVVFKSFWQNHYTDVEVICGGLQGFLLKKKDG